MKTALVFLCIIVVVLTQDSLGDLLKKREVLLINTGNLGINKSNGSYEMVCPEDDSLIQAKYIASRLRTIEDKRQRLLCEHIIQTTIYKALLGELTSDSKVSNTVEYQGPPPPPSQYPQNSPQNVVSYSNNEQTNQQTSPPTPSTPLNNPPYLMFSGTGEIPSEERAFLRKVHYECEADPATYADEDLLRKLRVHKDNRILQIHMFCMGEKAGLIRQDGTIDEEFSKSKIGLVIKDKNTVDEIYNKCAVQKRNKEETITYYWLCLILEGIFLTCTPSKNSLDFACSCGVGYTGRFCEQDVDECIVSNTCRNDATCRNTNGSYQCICQRGYEGKDCSINTDDCASSPCRNGGTCLVGTGEFTCLCVNGFEGKQCEIDIDECYSNPCQNGATCHQYVDSYTCTCPLGFSGRNCQTNDEDCTESICMYGGACIDGINAYSCICKPGYTGTNCQDRINLCDSNPCLNGAICQSHITYYTCRCPYGYTGNNCNEYVDWCSTSPCENHATCIQERNRYACECDPGWSGKICDVEMVSCKDSAQRKGVSWRTVCNNATCENIGNSHRCLCKEGYTGSYCQMEINKCESAPCQNAATCKDLIGSYLCICPDGYQGQNCELNVNHCQPNPCQNGGTCHDLVNGFQCSCPPGILCEINIGDCRLDSCHNNGTCVDRVGGFECKCSIRFVGPRCEEDINECLSNPCSNPGNLDCVQLVNGYHCNCKVGYMGRHCEISDHNAPARIGRVKRSQQDFNSLFAKDLETQRQQCIINNCPMKRGNLRCDEVCNTYACDFDGNDCSLGINPWANCNASIKCREVFMDGICNEDCNNLECLFDGRDCEKKLQACNPIYNSYCQKHYANGNCDYGCNSAECNWDGLDCEKGSPDLAEGIISMVILMDMETFKKNLVAFLRDTSHQLRTTIRVKKDQLGNDMIYPWVGNTTSGDEYFQKKHNITYVEETQSGIKVYLEIDNRKCTTISERPETCFPTVRIAEEFLAAKASKHTLPPNFPNKSFFLFD